MANQKIVTDEALSAFASDVKAEIANVSSPLAYKGTLGTGGTISTLPAASASNKGFAYVVITAGTYQGVVCAVSDVIASNGTAWDKIPQANSAETLPITTGSAVNTKEYIDDKTTFVKSASGSLVHITDGADNIPVKSLVSEIVAVQSGSGTPSPSNPRAISGFDNGVVSVIGKNWFDFEGWLNSNSIAYTKVGDSITFAPDSRLFTNPYVFSDRDINVSASVTNFTFNGTNLRLDFLNENNELQKAIVAGSLVRNNLNACKVRLNWSTIGTSVTIDKPMINLGTTVETYEAYNGNTYTFAFGQTVYGGHFDNKGNLVATHSIVDLSSLGWVYQSGNTRFYVDAPADLKRPASNNDVINGVCSHYIIADYQTYTDKQLCVSVSGSMFVKNSDYTDATAFINSLTGAYLVYELATPITLAITSQDIPTLLGENNFYSNCGDVEVDYYTDKAGVTLGFVNAEIGKKNGTNIPIEENSQDSIKDYVDNEVSSINLNSLPDTDITNVSAGQVLSFDGDNWVNNNQIVVKYEEKDITFDSSGEGTLYYANGYILGLKDIPSDSLYIGYITYMAGTKTMVKGFNRSVTSFDSTAIANTTRRIGIYYLDYITTQ